MDFKEGQILVFDKELDWTSFQLVNKVRWLICKKMGFKKLKVGHAGTLDPLATGVVVICTGKFTKRIEQIQAEEKEYITTIRFGETTPSFDLETEIDHTFPYEHINEELINEKLKDYLGSIDQVPPIFSAVKINGKRAYDYARKNQEVEIKSKKIEIKEFELLEYNAPEAKFRIVCSKGTYIRSLARDLGKSLDSGGHLIQLRRTRSGKFSTEKAMSLADFEKKLDNFATN